MPIKSNRSWVTVLPLVVGTAGVVRAQADSAIILTIPAIASASKCSTTVERPKGTVTVSLTLNAGPLSDTRMAIGIFDTAGHPLSLRDAGFRVQPPVIESATVEFDSAGRARRGLGQYFTPNDFSEDSTGKLHPRLDRPTFRPLTHAQMAKAEKVSAWLWNPECRSTNASMLERK